MRRRRILDGLIGAGIMLVALLIVAAVTWLGISRPEGATDEAASPTPVSASDAPKELGNEDIWLGDLDMQSSAMELPESSLLDVDAVATGVLSTPDGLTARELDVHATLPFDEVSQRLGAGSVISMGEGGVATIDRPVLLQGRQIQVRASGKVQAVNGKVVVEPTEVDVEGPEFLSWLATQAAKQFVRIEHPIEGLPQGLVLRDVEVQEDGFRAHLTGADVVLSEGGA